MFTSASCCMPRPLPDEMSINNPLLSSQTLGIIYTVVSRGMVILANHASVHGNFTEVTQQVLDNIPAEVDGKLTYASGE